MRYWPVPSVIDDRTFSISTELDASTVTPGRTAPEASLTVPVIEDWARANAGTKTVNVRRIHVLREPMQGIAAHRSPPQDRNG